MMNVSSQDLRNLYEKMYAELRKYLWPYSVLEELAQVEMDIYSAFVHMDKLDIDFAKLKKSTKDVVEEDKALRKIYKGIDDILNEKDAKFYARLPRVAETDPMKPKQIKTVVEEDTYED